MQLHKLHQDAHSRAVEHVTLRMDWLRTGNVEMLARHCAVPLAIYSDESIAVIQHRDDLEAMYSRLCETVFALGPTEVKQTIVHVCRLRQARVAIELQRTWSPRFGPPLRESLVYRMRVAPAGGWVSVEMVEILRIGTHRHPDPLS